MAHTAPLEWHLENADSIFDMHALDRLGRFVCILKVKTKI